MIKIPKSATEEAYLKVRQYLAGCCKICGLELREIGLYTVNIKPGYYRFRVLIGHPILAFIGVVWWGVDPVLKKESFEFEVILEPAGKFILPDQLEGRLDNYGGSGPVKIPARKVCEADEGEMKSRIAASFDLVAKILEINKLERRFTDRINMFSVCPFLDTEFDQLARDSDWGVACRIYEARAALKFKNLLYPLQAEEFEVAIVSGPQKRAVCDSEGL